MVFYVKKQLSVPVTFNYGGLTNKAGSARPIVRRATKGAIAGVVMLREFFSLMNQRAILILRQHAMSFIILL